MSKTLQDLFAYAKQVYRLDQDRTIHILKMAGFDKFSKKNWWIYLNLLREHWPYLKQARVDEKERKEKRDRLCSLVATLEKEVDIPTGVWRYKGSEEALAAKLELDAEDRERRVKQMKKFQVVT